MLSKKKGILLILFITGLFIIQSCSKSSQANDSLKPLITDSIADITSFKILNSSASISPKSINIRLDDTILNANNIVATFTISPGCQAKVNGISQLSGTSKNNFNSSIGYDITNTQGYTKQWIVNATNNDFTVDWGLGNFLKQSLSNDHSYNWYFNQVGSGKYSSINCGPTCAIMATKWIDSSSQLTPSDARDYYPKNIDPWGMGTIATFIADHGCLYKSVNLGDSAIKTRNILKAELDKGNIVIISITTAALHPYIGIANNPKVGKYYTFNNNHAILLYGYKEVDNEFYFQVNDPWGASFVNKDGTFCGTNRYYTYEDIFSATVSLDNNCLSIYKQ